MSDPLYAQNFVNEGQFSKIFLLFQRSFWLNTLNYFLSVLIMVYAKCLKTSKTGRQQGTITIMISRITIIIITIITKLK